VFGDTRSPILGDKGDSTQRSLARTGTTSTELEPPTSRIRKQTALLTQTKPSAFVSLAKDHSKVLAR
jgi:hypothetical protein